MGHPPPPPSASRTSLLIISTVLFGRAAADANPLLFAILICKVHTNTSKFMCDAMKVLKFCWITCINFANSHVWIWIISSPTTARYNTYISDEWSMNVWYLFFGYMRPRCRNGDIQPSTVAAATRWYLPTLCPTVDMALRLCGKFIIRILMH